ncbi:three-Cys-motif partner protein TcmP [Oleiharenicola lentus]|uniref:three-Cys-motif partner protein TcmP n=1 Tax=Oleiharenicola lentus TaxID=2508720 RepID=UPI003F66AACD
MSKKSDHKRFYWEHWQSGQLPELEDHSEKKLDLLRDYLVLYLQIVLKNSAGKEVQEITLIDGFAGGGLYQGKKLGSPITILKAVEEADFLVNQDREKPTRIVPICYFIEKDADAFACLDATLKAYGYGDRIGKTIHLRKADFMACAPEIIGDINARHKRGGNRTIFFLDQCGWTEISADTIRTLAQKLNHRPEFIINFAISWLTDFLSDKTQGAIEKSLHALGLDGFVDIPAMMKLRMDLGGHWEHAVESHIGEGFHKATGIAYFSPFYIEPKGNHRGYWLLHLAQSARARSAMTEIHWSKANRSKHYGYLGYDMLSFKPSLDQTQFIAGMSFDEECQKRCEETLSNDFARLLSDSHKAGIIFRDFIDQTSNKVMATSPMVHKVMWQLCQTHDFEVICPSGREKRTDRFADDDVIRPRNQLILTGWDLAPAQRKMRVSGQ